MILHWPFANYYNAWRELEKLYEEGKLRAIGVSNFEPGQLVDLIAYNRIVPAIDQIETNLYCQRAEERKWLDKKNVAHMAYAPLGQGNRNEMFSEPEVTALAEKFAILKIPMILDRSKDEKGKDVSSNFYWRSKEKYQKSTTQILLRFLTQKGIIVIPRSTKPEHIRENFDIFDFILTEDELSKLTALDQKTALIGNPNNPELVEMSLTW